MTQNFVRVIETLFVLVGLSDKPFTISNDARRHRLDLSRSISDILRLADAAKAVEH